MPDLINPFSVYGVAELGEAINVLPNMYGRVNQLNIFPVKGITTTVVAVEEYHGSLTLLPVNPRGAPGTAGTKKRRKLRTFAVPQINHMDGIEPDEVNGVREFGGVNQASLDNLVNDKLSTAKSKHDITLEFMRMGALKGVVVDGAGVTVFDYYSEFGITQKVVDFAFSNVNLDVRSVCLSIPRWMEDNILGDTISGVRALVSPEWFDALTSHPNVKAAYANYADAAQRLGGDMRKGFTFGGVTFEEYRANAPDVTGTTQKFIAANEGHAYPEGTQSTFRTYAAPGDFNDTVGQVGQLYYARIEPRDFNRGYDALTQSNPLPMCMRPQVLVKLTKS